MVWLENSKKCPLSKFFERSSDNTGSGNSPWAWQGRLGVMVVVVLEDSISESMIQLLMLKNIITAYQVCLQLRDRWISWCRYK